MRLFNVCSCFINCYLIIKYTIVATSKIKLVSTIALVLNDVASSLIDKNSHTKAATKATVKTISEVIIAVLKLQ